MNPSMTVKMMKMKKNPTDVERKVRSKGFRQKLAMRLDDVHDQRTAMVRAKYIERWNQMCGGQYSLDHPVVHLEWELCDMTNQHLLMKGKREEFFERAKLTDEEKAIYLNGLCDGEPYTTIESMKIRKETGRAIKMVVKRKI